MSTFTFDRARRTRVPLVSVTRLLDEADIIEAFVRHHAAFLDHLVLLDSGSTDDTLAILRALKAEGLPLMVLQTNAVHFAEVQHNTFLLNFAAEQFAADWILFLDADEFLDTRGLPSTLQDHLQGIAPDIGCVKVRLVNYRPSDADETDDALIPRRIRKREAPTNVLKCFVRNSLVGPDVIVEAGNHDVIRTSDGKAVPSVQDPLLMLAHYSMRDTATWLAKAVRARLRVLAAGEFELQQNRSSHYTWFVDALCGQHPEQVLNEGLALGASRSLPLVDDPLPYAGSELRHTVRPDPLHHALKIAFSAAEGIARAHGHLLDTLPGARSQADKRALSIKLLREDPA